MSELTNIFSDIANAIRAKAGTSSGFAPSQMASGIMNIPSGGGDFTYVAPRAYQNNSTITSYSGSETVIFDRAFQSCRYLSKVSFSECQFIEDSAFNNCYTLSTISFPQASYIGYGAFTGCSALSAVSFPKVNSMADSAFWSCGISTATFDTCTRIGSNAFAYCDKLISVLLSLVLLLFNKLSNSSLLNLLT